MKGEEGKGRQTRVVRTKGEGKGKGWEGEGENRDDMNGG